MRILVILLVTLLVTLVLYRLLRRRALGQVSRERLYERGNRDEHGDTADHLDRMGFMRRWLYLSGYRRPVAPWVFAMAAVTALAGGLLGTYALNASGLSAAMIAKISMIPGGAGDVFLPLAWFAPWAVLLVIASIPWLVVRASRRRRLEQVEQDLPLALELLATLSEAGLGFDAALTQVLASRLSERSLAQEFRTFQADLLAGRPRHDGLRRVARRLEITSVTVVISALVQADQLGMGIARVLRIQADEMRSRRRERAVALSNALPVKRLFPLVICFLPGLFVWSLGPLLLQLMQLADTFVRVRSF